MLKYDKMHPSDKTLTPRTNLKAPLEIKQNKAIQVYPIALYFKSMADLRRQSDLSLLSADRKSDEAFVHEYNQ